MISPMHNIFLPLCGGCKKHSQINSDQRNRDIKLSVTSLVTFVFCNTISVEIPEITFNRVNEYGQ